jgi:hypothetical protein
MGFSFPEAGDRRHIDDLDYDGLDNHTERKLGLDPKDNLPDPPEPAAQVPMRLEESLSSPVNPSTPVPTIEAEPLYGTATGEPYRADDFGPTRPSSSTTPSRHPRREDRTSECAAPVRCIGLRRSVRTDGGRANLLRLSTDLVLSAPKLAARYGVGGAPRGTRQDLTVQRDRRHPEPRCAFTPGGRTGRGRSGRRRSRHGRKPARRWR